MSVLTLQILDLVNTGRISADEAVRLIRAADLRREGIASHASAMFSGQECCPDFLPVAGPEEYWRCGTVIIK